MSENKGGPEYLFEKTQEVKRIKAKKAFNKRLMVFFSICFVFLLIAIYFSSDYSKIRYINIKGNNLLTENEIIEKIGIKEGEYKIFVHTKDIKERIQDLTLVKSTSVNVDVEGNLNIFVDEKRPLLYWISNNTVKVLFDDKSIYEIDGTKGFKWLLNIPMVQDISEENILDYIYESILNLDANILSNIIKIKSYPLSYDDKNVVLYFNDDNYVLCNMAKIDKANSYYQILTNLKVNNSCVFYDSYSNNGYSSNCPWEIEQVENEDINDTNDIIENEDE